MSSLFLKTLREDPADAEVPSHRWLVRAGYVRRVAPGIYSWLPLGLIVLHKIEEIVREEMNAIGGQEVLLPALLPAGPYKETDRWVEYGDNLFRLVDRKGADMLLGPTHEEMFTLMAKDQCKSYKALPLKLYQIQAKYRDEARPRAGILRGREFVMKDSYSFDIDAEGLEASYQDHRRAYIRIFDRLGFKYAIVRANSGAMGGSASEEFLAVSDNGEDTFVRSPGGYAANIEAVDRPLSPEQDASLIPPAEVHPTPDSSTIEALVSQANKLFPRDDREWQAHDTLKNVIFKLRAPDGTTEPLAVGLPGDRDVDDARLEVIVAPCELEDFDEEDFERYPQLAKGYIGPSGLKAAGIRYLLDPEVVPGTAWLTGADKPGYHVANLVAGRDFDVEEHSDVAVLKEGDPAPDGSGPLSLARGIEMGHIFQLGTKYAEALGLKVLDQNGKLQTVTMGSYGVGVSRAVGAVAEATCDDKGLCWPRGLTPFDVMVLATGKGEEIAQAAFDIAAGLDQAGISVLLDDRKVSPGVKFKDSEILGIPTSVVVGRALSEGKIEIRDRKSGGARLVESQDALDQIKAEIGR